MKKVIRGDDFIGAELEGEVEGISIRYDPPDEENWGEPDEGWLLFIDDSVVRFNRPHMEALRELITKALENPKSFKAPRD